MCSAIGKLFSKILLDRFITYREKTCPTAPNQLGFTKNAQTYDHILSLHTIASKYKRLGSSVYVTFVDFRKAFDSVCRQALFLKLAQSNVTGKFYNILKDMYSNSEGQIKLSGHLSNKFNIRKGTEQGHTLSPDLFKLYLSDLSPLLDFPNCPKLANTIISHLLWADDLIMTALDKETAQQQLNQLNNFCIKWGIEVNMLKTKTMVMGKQQNKADNPKFKLGIHELDVTNNYCYLGIIIENSGSLKLATESLKDKSMRAFFGLKRTVNKTKVRFRALTTLFDSLIKPIALYGSPIWLPSLHIINKLTSSIESLPHKNSGLTKNMCKMECEKVHLSFLRWALGVHKKTSTIGCWGETGRYPLLYQSIKLTLDYFQRIKNSKEKSLVHAAFIEQKTMKLNWYKNIELILKLDTLFEKDHVTAFNLSNKSKKYTNPTSISSNTIRNPIVNHNKFRIAKPISSGIFKVGNIMKILKTHFVDCWKYGKSSSKKLMLYYDKIKNSFCKEQYLDYVKKATNRYKTTQLRISAHDLEIEAGRYKDIPRDNRFCKWCLLTLDSKQIEDENHVLFTCDLYAPNRSKLIKTLNDTIKNTGFTENKDSHFDQDSLKVAFESINHLTLATVFPRLQSPMHDATLTATNITMTNLLTDCTTVTFPIPHDPLQIHKSQDSYITSNIPLNNEDSIFLENIRSYIQNAISS